MAIHGRYVQVVGKPALPRIRVRVVVGAMLKSAVVDFLVDTGADRTTLMPRDVSRFGLDLQSNEFVQNHATGVGGRVQTRQTSAALLFMDDKMPRGLRGVNLTIHLLLPEDEQAGAGLPSLLGRDFLNRCECVFDPANNRLAMSYGATHPA